MNTPLFDSRRYLIPFRSSLLPQIFCDTLVIGAGVAGARAAIAAAEKLSAAGGGNGGVIVLAKEEPLGGTGSAGLSPGGNNTAWAQGGIAAVFDSSDTVESHLRDTLVAGAGCATSRSRGWWLRKVRRGCARSSTGGCGLILGLTGSLFWGVRAGTA